MKLSKKEYNSILKEKEKSDELFNECSLILANCVDFIIKHHGRAAAIELLKLNGAQNKESEQNGGARI